MATSHPIHDRSLSVASAATVAFELLPWSVAVLDDRGTIVAVNKAWRDSVRREALGLDDDGVGANYLEICDTARGHGAEDARAVAEAIRDLLSASPAEYLFEYSCHSPTERRWILARFLGGERLMVSGSSRLSIRTSPTGGRLRRQDRSPQAGSSRLSLMPERAS